MGGAGNGIHTHIHSAPRDTQHGWSLGIGSDAILTHVGVAHSLIKLLGYELQEEVAGGGEQAMANTHTHTHTHTVSLVIHVVDGASAEDRTKSSHM